MNTRFIVCLLVSTLVHTMSGSHRKIVADLIERIKNKGSAKIPVITMPSYIPRDKQATTETTPGTHSVTTTTIQESNLTHAIHNTTDQVSIFHFKVTLIPILLIILALIWIISASYLLLFCLKRRKHKPKRVYVELLPKLPNIIKNEAYLHERLAELEYDKSYEVDRSCVEFGNFIAGGHFGEVYDGTLSIGLQSRGSSVLPVFPKKKLPVAIKIAGNATASEDIALQTKLLEDELKLLCSVGSHPNVVTLIGAVTQKNSQGIWIVMEKCLVGNLSHFLKSRRNTFIPQFEKTIRDPNDTEYTKVRFSENKLVSYKQLDKKANWKTDLSKDITTAHLLSFAMQIAEGMNYLSSQKCVHRDLAARNIILLNEGIVKISDFGLAKRMGYAEYYRSQSCVELPCRWMSAEALKDLKFSIESDIWSYGILLYELFTLGGLPFPDVSNDNLIEKVLMGEINPQPQYCPDIIYQHMTLCWLLEIDKRPSFRVSAELMKYHLFQASKEVFKTTTKEFQRALERQKQLSILRKNSQQKAEFSN